MKNPAHFPAQCVANTTTVIIDQKSVKNIMYTRINTIPTCCRIQNCSIHVDRLHWQRVIPIMSRINNQFNAQIFAKVGGYSTRTLEPNKGTYKIHTNTHPNHNGTHKLRNTSYICNSCGFKKSPLRPNKSFYCNTQKKSNVCIHFNKKKVDSWDVKYLHTIVLLDSEENHTYKHICI